jgi:RimJ/RimL family protein N-acetyltransferase
VAETTNDGLAAASPIREDPEPVLTTDRLLLEPLTASHAAVLFEPLRDPALYRFIPDDPPEAAELEEQYRFWEARRSPDGSEAWLNWALRRRVGAEYVGTLQASVLPDQSAFVAYVVFAQWQRQGYATEALARLVDYLIADLGATVVVAEIDTRNLASIALVERLGFHRVAMRRDADHFKGAPSDEYRYEFRPATGSADPAVAAGSDG